MERIESDIPGYCKMQTGLYIPERHRRYSLPTCVDLFSGAGGFSLGFIQAGFQVVMGVDNEVWATMTYLHNLGSNPLDMRFTSDKWRKIFEKALEDEQKRAEKEARKNGSLIKPFVSGGNWHGGNGLLPVPHFYFGDVRELTGKKILDALDLEVGELDCVIGGPPCQGFSKMGKRNVMDPRNSLVFEFARLVIEMKPKTMVMENVPGMVSMVTPKGLPVVDAFCRVLEDGGFGVYEALKRSLLSTAGMGAALRNKSRNTKEEKQEPDESMQGELFQ